MAPTVLTMTRFIEGHELCGNKKELAFRHRLPGFRGHHDCTLLDVDCLSEFYEEYYKVIRMLLEIWSEAEVGCWPQ
jgi:hypothetical protein